MPGLVTAVVVSLPPVLVFLLALVWLDSYKLVRPRHVAAAIAAGAAAAAVGLVVNRELLHLLEIRQVVLSRYAAPPIEEVLKAVPIVVLMRRYRIGFLVDAAIFGFAVGAGFALVENIYYLTMLPDAGFGVWLVRGFGTAVMHGGTTAMFALVSKTLSERKASTGLGVFLPGLVPSAIVHSVFNHFILSAVASTLVVLVALPALVAFVFWESERSLRRWLGTGFDADTRLLETIQSGELPATALGRYLQALQARFPGEVLVDMLCYVRLHTELALRAKGELMMREHGFASAIEPEVRAKFQEMKFLEGSLGPTGRLALLPILHASSRDLWQIYMLERQ